MYKNFLFVKFREFKRFTFFQGLLEHKPIMFRPIPLRFFFKSKIKRSRYTSHIMSRLFLNGAVIPARESVGGGSLMNSANSKCRNGNPWDDSAKIGERVSGMTLVLVIGVFSAAVCLFHEGWVGIWINPYVISNAFWSLTSVSDSNLKHKQCKAKWCFTIPGWQKGPLIVHKLPYTDAIYMNRAVMKF